ncbi:cytochrome P450 52A2 [Diutina catenulata]
MWLALAAAVVVYFVAQSVWLWSRRRKFPEARPVQKTLQDNALGFRFLGRLMRERANGNMPVYFESLFVDHKTDTLSATLAGITSLSTRDPENVKALLGTQFTDFCLGWRLASFGPLLGEGIFTLDGQGWKHSRAMLRPQFAREQVAHVKSLEPHIQVLAAHIRNAGGRQLDLQPLFFRFTMDSATEFLFGESIDSLKDASVGYSDDSSVSGRAEFAEMFNNSQEALAQRFLLQKLYWLYNPKHFQDSNKLVHQVVDYYVDRALAMTPEDLEKSNGYVFLTELAKETRDRQVLRAQSLNILLAGRDTTAGTLSFAFHSLAKNPEVFDRLKQEIRTHFGAEDTDLAEITFESLKKCEYLKAVISETLRMYPIVPGNSRDATKDTTIPRGGGPNGDQPVFVPKGQTVFYNVFAMHRSEALYGKDAHEWRPERWLEPESSRLGWAYLPFNGGPRICLGQQFALTEMSYVIVRLLQLFDKIEDYNDDRTRLATHLTMSLMDGCNVALQV